MKRKCISLFVVAVMLFNMLMVMPMGSALAEENDGLVLWYKFDEASGTTISDSSGNGINGVLQGSPSWQAGRDGSALFFNGTNNYINMGNSQALQPRDMTIAFWYKKVASIAGQEHIIIWAKPSGQWNANGFYLTIKDQAHETNRPVLLMTNGSVASWVEANVDEFYPLNEWVHIAVTLDSSTNKVSIYKNGVPQQVSSNGTPAITATSDVKYLGFNSPGYNGGYLRGGIDDFRIYNRALSAAEILQLASVTDDEAVRRDKEALTLGDVSAVVSDLKLPTVGENGSTITWSSSNPAVISNDGKVTRPPYGSGNATVILTATITKGEFSDTKTFEVTVLEDTSDQESVALDKEALRIGNTSAVKDDLKLPTKGANGSTITWSSSNPAVISNEGKVTRPAKGSGNATVILTATITKGSASDTKEFTVTVLEEGAGVVQFEPFKLSQVRLLDGEIKNLMKANADYLHRLDADRLLHSFRLTAGLQSSATPLGGWESPSQLIRGHTMGHYLSACAMLYASTGDEEIKEKADYIVAELAKCQEANGNGYLSAFPEVYFDNVERGSGSYWVPWYTMHKIMAGLLDMYLYTDNEQALDVLEKLAYWAKNRTDKLNDDQMNRLLQVEFGGMNEVLYNLYEVTGNTDFLNLAHRFDHEAIFGPLAQGRDQLAGLHANTQIPKIVGAARRYELVEEERYHDIAKNFWDIVVYTRTYATGGNSNNEHFGPPNVLASTLSNVNHETFNTYNMLRLTRHLFEWTGDPEYADYYERAYINGILSTMNPATGMKMYFVPQATGYFKVFHTETNSFYCCTGTGMESFAKLGDSIYFHRGNDELYVNLFIASMLNWDEKGIQIEQQTTFPDEEGTKLIVHADNPTELAINIRVPYWATNGVTIKINGEVQNIQAEPSSYVTLDRVWKDGDTIEVSMPMSLHLMPLPDDPDKVAILYGPMVLCGLYGTDNMQTSTVGVSVLVPNRGSYTNSYLGLPEDIKYDVDKWLEPVEGKNLTFKTVDEVTDLDVTLVPFYRMFDQRYGVYWDLGSKDQPPLQKPTLKPFLWYTFDEVNGNTVIDHSGNGNNGTLVGGATITTNGKDGKAVDLNGSNGYVQLPAGIMKDVGETTITAWVYLDSVGQWSRIFDFGNGTSTYMFLSPQRASNPRYGFVILTPETGTEVIFGRNNALSAGSWIHVAVVLKGSTAVLYENGVEVARSNTFSGAPYEMGNTLYNYIGKSQYSADPYLDGRVDDFRIYNRALSAEEIQMVYRFEEPVITEIEPITIETVAGTSIPVLPQTVKATYSNGLTFDVEVAWGDVDPEIFLEPGTHILEGTVEGTDIKAIANIIVKSSQQQEDDFIVNTTFNLDKLETDRTLNARVEVTNKSSNKDSVMAIVALYDGNNRMVNVAYISKHIPIGETEYLNAGFVLIGDMTGHVVKVFVWDGTSIEDTNMQPISNVVELK